MRDSEIKTLFAKADEQVHVDEIRKQRLQWGIFRDRREECYQKIVGK